MNKGELFIALVIGLFLGTVVSRQLNVQSSGSCGCKDNS
jgi:hypothetical protein